MTKGDTIELDPLAGKPDDEDDDSGKGKKRRASRSSSKERKRKPSANADNNLRGRLTECFERIAATLEKRGDDELAEIVREDANVMAQGLVSLTRPFRIVRVLVLGIVSIVEPVLAFGRLARAVMERWALRRTERAAAREYAESEPGA